MDNSIWVILPPLVVVIAAVITKEVYSSLVLGVLIGCLLFTGFHPIPAIETFYNILTNIVTENASLLIFLVLLGIIVALITKSGATHAYGIAAKKVIKSRRAAMVATSALGALIFIDDYFNCLTVGAVMSPITDKFKISRAKLAYIIDSTAAPICILAPISSWSAAIAASLPSGSALDGYVLFLQSIPFNIYAILSLVFLFWLMIIDKDFFTMKKYNDELEYKEETIVSEEIREVGNGKVIDIIIPIVALIIICILCMINNGGYFKGGVTLIESFQNCDSMASLVTGALITLILIFVLYIPRKIVTYVQFAESLVDGFKSMTGAIVILCLSWTLAGICSADYLNLGGFIAGILSNFSTIYKFMPVIFFIVALVITFATGASWGAFAILIPIIVTVFPTESTLLTLTMAACLAGAVAGDHISPLSDTSILSSAGAQCVHLSHVKTQLPYCMVVIAVSTIGYLIGGIYENGWTGLLVSTICLIIFMIAMTYILNRKDKNQL